MSIDDLFLHTTRALAPDPALPSFLVGRQLVSCQHCLLDTQRGLARRATPAFCQLRQDTVVNVCSPTCALGSAHVRSIRQPFSNFVLGFLLESRPLML